MNTLRSILLHLDATPRSAARLAIARSLALGNDAALSAMFLVSPGVPSVQLAFSESPAAVMQPVDAAEIARAKAMFEAEAQGGPAMRWLDPEGGSDIDAFCAQALYADVLVLGQHDDTVVGTAPADFIESVLIATGKPALVIPRLGRFETIGKEVLIGWNGRPEAAHAVTAALPWLRNARRVHVLEAFDGAPAAGRLDITQYLALHGISAQSHRHRGANEDAGEALLSFAVDVDADLLVMGCYGHSRARELVMGGASRSVLRTMTLPVLMSH
jgi:nucleotide-binding universal stress UspA family protein